MSSEREATLAVLSERRSRDDLIRRDHRACSAPKQRREPALAVVGAPKPLWPLWSGEARWIFIPATPIALAPSQQQRREARSCCRPERRSHFAVVGAAKPRKIQHSRHPSRLPALPQQRAAFARRRHLQPDRIPVRILARRSHQPSAYWITHDIAPDSQHLFVASQGMLMESMLPYRQRRTHG